jgi:hypothetical protein
MGKDFPWRHPKKDDVEARPLASKKKEAKPRNRVHVRIEVVQALYNSEMLCDG